MTIKASTPDEYIAFVAEDKRDGVSKLRNVVKANIPAGFEETINYNMIGYVVPHSTYPGGYHCDPKQPLPFLNIAAQKNFIALYHMGMYADPDLLKWFTEEYPKHSSYKLDMGKSCIRFKSPQHIPYDLIGQLVKKMNPDTWISVYERVFKSK